MRHVKNISKNQTLYIFNSISIKLNVCVYSDHTTYDVSEIAEKKHNSRKQFYV